MNSNKIYVVCLQIVKFNLYCVLTYNNMSSCLYFTLSPWTDQHWTLGRGEKQNFWILKILQMDPLDTHKNKTFLLKPLFMKVKTCIGNLQYMCFLTITYWPSWLKTRKLRYLCHMASKWKNNGTFFSSTLKVQEKNVPLFFSFEASWLRYDHFLIFIRLRLIFSSQLDWLWKTFSSGRYKVGAVLVKLS